MDTSSGTVSFYMTMAAIEFLGCVQLPLIRL